MSSTEFIPLLLFGSALLTIILTPRKKKEQQVLIWIEKVKEEKLP